jgi:23S rRNA A1618 N6-methylase RlmF
MKDRRKNLYCGPEHKLIPTLTALADYIKRISDDVQNTNPYNWPDKIKQIGIFASCAGAEVDKLIMIDCKEVKKGE